MDRWIEAQKIGFAAFWCRYFWRDGEVRRRARERFISLLGAYGDGPERLLTLPPSTLHLITRIPARRLAGTTLAGCPDAAVGALDQLIGQPDHSPLALAKIMAFHVMHGVGDERRTIRFGRTLFGKTWSSLDKPVVRDALGAALSVLRSPNEKTDARRRAISMFVENIAGTPHCEQIENALLQAAFTWPLLVIEESGAEVGVSLPVALDIEFTNVVGGVNEGVEVVRSGICNLTVADRSGRTFKHHLREARKAACHLWRKNHGNNGTFRGDVLNHVAVFDFEPASRVANSVLDAIDLRDGSAAPYFSQAILARLLGKQSYLSSAITGMIGEPVLYEDLSFARDYRFMPPGGIDEKVRFVFESNGFEQLVLPDGAQGSLEVMLSPPRRGDDAASADDDTLIGADRDGDVRPAAAKPAPAPETSPVEQTAQVAFADRLSTVADIVQTRGWRRFSYIRMPDIGWALHGRNPQGGPTQGLLAPTDLAVQPILERLRNNPKPVLRLDRFASARAVASALWHIEMELRPNATDAPPGLSWAFIRAVDDEQDGRFWQVVWRIITAPDAEFDLFLHSPTRLGAVRRLADALNCWTPTRSHPSHRAPDVMVVVGTDTFSDNLKRSRNPLSRTLATAEVLAHFERDDQLLDVSEYRKHSDVLRRSIGRTRFILLPADRADADVPAPPSSTDLRGELDDILRVLSTFRFSFTQQQAGLLLAEEFGLRGNEVRQRLKSLVEVGSLREWQGQYHVPRDLKRDIDSVPIPTHVRAAREFSAGVAFAPYIVNADVTGLTLEQAMLPENVHEAEHHAGEAYTLERDRGVKPWANTALQGFQRLTRFASLPNWGGVVRLNKARQYKDAYNLSQDLIEAWDDHPDNRVAYTPLHPAQFFNAATALNGWKPADLSGVLALIDRGLASCAAEAYQEEERTHFTRLQLLSLKWVSLAKAGRRDDEGLGATGREIDDLRSYWTIIPGELFECRGDRATSDAAAFPFYLDGTQYASRWAQNWIKAAGAGLRGGNDISELRRRLRALDEEDALLLCSAMRRAFENLRGWADGLPLLKESWWRWRGCRGHLAEMEDLAAQRVR